MAELGIVCISVVIIVTIITVVIWKQQSNPKPLKTLDQINREIERDDKELLKMFEETEDEEDDAQEDIK